MTAIISTAIYKKLR